MFPTLHRTKKAAPYVIGILFLISLGRKYSNTQLLPDTCDAIYKAADVAVSTLRKEIRESQRSHSSIPTIYIITPTYGRPTQMADMTRLASTLMLVKNIVWIVAEDGDGLNPFIGDLLEHSGITYMYIVAKMPKKYHTEAVRRLSRRKRKKQDGEKLPKKPVEPRGVSGRLAGLKLVRENAIDGVVYFADDDNSYDLRIFEEMRWTRGVSMWPVGLVTKLGVSTPILQDGKWIDWYDGWKVDRKFPVDMAGFAVSVRLLKEVPEATMPYVPGYEEDGFLRSLGIHPEDIEFKAENCTKVYVWHTQTRIKHTVTSHALEKSVYDSTNLRMIRQFMVFDDLCYHIGDCM